MLYESFRGANWITFLFNLFPSVVKDKVLRCRYKRYQTKYKIWLEFQCGGYPKKSISSKIGIIERVYYPPED